MTINRTQKLFRRVCELEDLVRDMAAMFDGVDNGSCASCGSWRIFVDGKPGVCENAGCISHRIRNALMASVTPDAEEA